MVIARRSLLAGFVFIAAIAAAPPDVQVGRIQVLVAPDRPDWLYQTGEKAAFTVQAIENGATIGGVRLTYSCGPEMMDPTFTKTVTLTREGLRIDAGTMNQPGFLRCVATVERGGEKYRGLGTAAFSPLKIEPAVQDPADFDSFWQAGKDELAKIPIDAERTLLPDLSTSKVNVYHVSLANAGPVKLWNSSARVFGILCMPKAPGKYPARLGVPGAGVHKIGGMIREAEQGVITLNIGIHGIPLTLDQKVYSLLGSGALNGYWVYNLDSRDRYYYRRVYLGCVRAVDYLTSLEEWDGAKLAVTGVSQGGALSIVTAGLDPRIKALAAYFPALSDLPGYASGRAGGWPHMFKDAENRTKEKLDTAAYYDVVNFARRVKAPGLYSWGYNDEVCPPTSTYAAYNQVKAPKRLILALETGHWTVKEQQDAVGAWLMKYLKTGVAGE